MQAYTNKPQGTFVKAVDGDWNVCVRLRARAHVYVLRTLITKDKILPFSNYNAEIHIFINNFAAHLVPCGGTPIANHWLILHHSASYSICS
jgi:hypothetical protein